MQVGILFGPWRLICKVMSFPARYLTCWFDWPPEVIQITLHVILAVSCWGVLCLIQSYKSFIPRSLPDCPFKSSWRNSGNNQVLQDRYMDQAPPERQWISSAQEKKGTRKHRSETQWYPGDQMSFFLQILEWSICSLLILLHPNPFFFCNRFKRMESS